MIMAKTLIRDEVNWTLLRQTKNWKKYIVKRLANWKFITLPQ